MIYMVLALFAMFGLQAGEGMPSFMEFMSVMNAMRGDGLMGAMSSTGKKKSRIPAADQRMLFDAVENGNCDKIANYLDEHENVVPKGLLHVALQKKQKDVTNLLLARGANLNERCGGEYPIHAAARFYPEMLETLIAKGACVHSVNKNGGETALYTASQKGHKQGCITLLKHGARVNARDHDLGTPLSTAVYNGHQEIAEQLLDAGAQIDVRTHERATPLQIAIARKHTPVALDLMARGAKLNVKTKDGSAELHYLLRHNEYDADIFKALLDRGADARIIDNQQVSPLFIAAGQGHLQAAKELIPLSDINAMTVKGNTPLFIALWNAHEQMALELLQVGADPNCGQGHHKPLHIAAHKNLIAAAQLLLQKGANPLMRDKADKLPCYYAKSNAMITLLSNATEQQ